MANGVETTYRRCGSGRTVLLLGAPEAIALALGTSFRVIVPEVPLHFADASATRWLGGVCDGLGIDEATIVATPAMMNTASQFAQDAPDRVKAVIVADATTLDLAGLRAAVERSFS